jgi:serine/threonine protein kinase
MDIKPKNILVRDVRPIRSASDLMDFRVYIADFGISRSYGPSEDCETHSILTAFSKPYAAPEVVKDWPRGLAADVFSLGCVFAEMLATICSSSKSSLWDELQSVRESNEDGDTSYSENIQPVQEFLRQGAFKPAGPEYHNLQNKINVVIFWTLQMLEFDPKLRPSSQTLAQVPELQTGCGRCDHSPEPFEAAPDLKP